MLRRYHNVVLDPYTGITFDFGNSLQNDETLIFTYKHNQNYASNTRLSLYNHDVVISLYGYTLSGHPSDNIFEIIIPRYAYCQIVIPANLIDNGSIDLMNDHSTNLDLYWGFSTIKGYLPPRINTGWIGYLENMIEYPMIDFTYSSIVRVSTRVVHYKNADTSTSIVMYIKSRNNSGGLFNTLHTFTANGTYTLENQLQTNPFKLIMTPNGTTSSDITSTSIYLLP